MESRFAELIAAAYTPLNLDGALNLATIDDLAQHYVDIGVTGVFVAGTTGESVSLTLDERRVLAECWANVTADSPLRTIVHVGGNCLPDCRQLAQWAQQAGADAISIMAPHYFKPSSVAQLVEFCRQVAEAAPELPFYFYDIPDLTGVRLPMGRFLELGSREIPSLAGIKYTNSDLVELQNCLRFDDAFEIYFGCDEALLAGLAFGVRGAVGSTYNFAAPLYRRIVEAFERGDLETARQLQSESVRMVQTLAKYGFMAAAKSVMALIGIDCGPVRSPLLPLSPELQEAVREDLDAIGFFQWSKPVSQPAS